MKKFILSKIFYLLVYIFAAWESDTGSHWSILLLKLRRDFVVRIKFILPAHRASHIINTIYCSSSSSFYKLALNRGHWKQTSHKNLQPWELQSLIFMKSWCFPQNFQNKITVQSVRWEDWISKHEIMNKPPQVSFLNHVWCWMTLYNKVHVSIKLCRLLLVTKTDRK